ncbi:MAG: glycosyltransferase family 4 protein [Chloroflexi bacterium]|nr:glycosyltransferase family 4 protein [Chloroflexota bacterium]
MKIGLVSPYDLAYPGGVTSHITHLYRHFRDAGHDVRIIAPSSRPEESGANPDVLVCGTPTSVPASGSIARITLSLRLSQRVKSILEQERFDVVHVHEPLMPMLPITVLRFSTAVNVGTFHAHRDRSLAYLYARRLLKRWFGKLDGKIAVSRPAAEFVSQYFPGYYNIIPNGIDLDYFHPDVQPLPQYCDGKSNILFVGRFEKRKGLRYLVRAYAALKVELPNSRLLIVGPDGGLQEGYERSIRKAGLPDVVFVGYVPFEELPRYYRTAQVFCSPATGQESQGIVLLEAMACGTPVVASNIEGFASVLTHNEEGLLVPPKDEDKLALALVHLLADGELRRQMGQRGQLTAQAYSWKRVSQQVLSYYERLLEERADPALHPEKAPTRRGGRSRWRSLLPRMPRRRPAAGSSR